MAWVPRVEPAILFYDQDCRFCVWGVVGLARRARPGAVRLAPIQGPLGRERLVPLDEDRRLASWHVWDGERLRSEADVLDVVGPGLTAGGLRAAVAVARLLPRPAVSAVYRLIAARRVTVSRFLPSGWKRGAERRLPGLLADGSADPDRRG